MKKKKIKILVPSLRSSHNINFNAVALGWGNHVKFSPPPPPKKKLPTPIMQMCVWALVESSGRGGGWDQWEVGLRDGYEARQTKRRPPPPHHLLQNSNYFDSKVPNIYINPLVHPNPFKAQTCRIRDIHVHVYTVCHVNNLFHWHH